VTTSHDAVRGAAYRGGGIGGHDLADDQPIEQVADRREPLLGGRDASLARQLLDVARNVERLHRCERGDAVHLTPCQKFTDSPRVGAPRVGIADRDSEKFEEASLNLLVGNRDQRGSTTVSTDVTTP
jgi:hypothetical protein